MSPPLGRWPHTVRHPALWRAHLGSHDPTRAAALALLDPHEPRRMVQALLDAQDWEDCELLLEEDLFRAQASPEDLDAWSERLNRARGEALTAWELRVRALRQRAEALGRTLDIQHAPGRRGKDDEDALQRHAKEIEAAEAARRAELRRKAEEAARGPEAGRWLEEIHHLIEQDAPDIEDLVASGPTPEPLHTRLPTPAPRALTAHPLKALLAAWLDEAPSLPALGPWRPPAGDTYAWRLMEALYRPRIDEGDVVIRCVAALLGTTAEELRRDADGWTARLADLSAPGFLALGRRRWPRGLPVWLPTDPDALPPTLDAEGLLLRLVEDGHPPVVPGQLLLDLRELLATLRFEPERRRNAVHATLGAQIPLRQLYTFQEADPSTAWLRTQPLPAPDPEDQRPLLISGPPGLGKTVLLERLAEARGVPVLRSSEELPEQDCVLIDSIASLGEREARALVRAIHWIADTSPPPFIVVVARPEAAARLREVRQGFFREERLKPLPKVDARLHIQNLLAWGGLRPEQPRLLDELAALGAWNPSALHALARALAGQLHDEGARGRTFSAAQVERAWARPALQERLRALFWEPLAALEGARALAQALTLLSTEPGLSPDDLRWVFQELSGGDAAGFERLVGLFEDYGLLLRSDAGTLSLPPSGPSRLLGLWSDPGPEGPTKY